jgi:hypothetical protein
MRHITDMLLLTNEEPNDPPIVALNEWCQKKADGQLFLNIEIDRGQDPPRGRASGGSKVFTTRVYACAGNFFPWGELIDALPSFGWDSYSAEVTVLIVQNESVERWIAVHADGGRVGRNRKEAWACGPQPPVGSRVIRSNGTYWNAIHGRWVEMPDDATVFFDTGLDFALRMLRLQYPDVYSIEQKTHR